VDPAGNVRSADKVADVPGPVRRNVMVVDLSRSPEERQADRYVYFVDVTAPGPDGKFHANVVSRYQVPLGKAGTGLPAGTDTGEASGVVLYSASWCGYCKKARAFFKQRNVPFQERDVEKDPGAEAALQKRARAAGVRVSGVPVIDFMGELVVGFDVPRLERLMARALEGQPSEAASGPTPVKRPAPGAGAPTSPSASP
jgi:glutaredoxin